MSDDDRDLHERFAANHRRWMKRHLDWQDFWERHRWLVWFGCGLFVFVALAAGGGWGWIIGGWLADTAPTYSFPPGTTITVPPATGKL